MPVRLDNLEPIDVRPITRALISVSDKTGLVDLGRTLARNDVEIVSTGSTASTLAEAGVPVTPVEDVTGFPEVLEGRVKTLHPAIHAGILADQRKATHRQQLADLDVKAFDLVVCNLYPFEETVASGAGVDECVEQIDIGGPTLVRAAAKNHPSVAVVTSPEMYGDIELALAEGGFTLDQRRELAAEAFTEIALYDLAISRWFALETEREDLVGEINGWFLETLSVDEVDDAADEAAGEAEDGTEDSSMPTIVGDAFTLIEPLRYGENPHQRAGVYQEVGAIGDLDDADPDGFAGVDDLGLDEAELGSVGHLDAEFGSRVRGDADGPYVPVTGKGEALDPLPQGELLAGIAHARQLHGKAMSFNNFTDGDAALRAAYDHEQPCVAIIKHANPCGIAVGADVAEAHRKAHACDPVSAFGGVIAVNRPVSLELAEQIAPIFTEVVLAPAFEDGALEKLSQKKNVRVLQVEPPVRGGFDFKQISGGLLVQSRDMIDAVGDDPANWELVSGEAADAATLADLAFAWRTVRAVRSNAVLLVKDGASVGVGMGQVNRVDSCKLAVERANTLGGRSTGDAAADASSPSVDSAGGARAEDVVADAPERRSVGSVAASDAFFPFADGLQVLIDAGVRAVVQPGGSIRDDESIEAAKSAGVTMYLTHTRHFMH